MTVRRSIPAAAAPTLPGSPHSPCRGGRGRGGDERVEPSGPPAAEYYVQRTSGAPAFRLAKAEQAEQGSSRRALPRPGYNKEGRVHKNYGRAPDTAILRARNRSR